MTSDGAQDGLILAFLSQRIRLEDQMRHRVGCRATAADLVQDLFLRIWQRGVTPIQQSSHYLRRSASNLAVDHYRALASRIEEGRDFLPEVPSGESPPDEKMMARDDAEAIRAALSALPPRVRQIFLLSRAHGRSYPEIARTLGVSVSAVEKDMMRALQACRRAIEHP